MKEPDEICDEISKKRNKIFENKEMIKEIEDYCYIKKEFERGNVNESLFQSRFKSFYRLGRSRPSKEFLAEYFNLMSDGQKDLKIILEKISKNGKIQFSFATKLMHTIDNSKPIWDKNVARVTGIEMNGKYEIQCCQCRYSQLEDLSRKLLKNDRMAKFILEFKDNFKGSKEISDAKALDFILWALGNENKRKGK